MISVSPSGRLLEEGRMGLEPMRGCLTGNCSAAELPTRSRMNLPPGFGGHPTAVQNWTNNGRAPNPQSVQRESNSRLLPGKQMRSHYAMDAEELNPSPFLRQSFLRQSFLRHSIPSIQPGYSGSAGRSLLRSRAGGTRTPTLRIKSPLCSHYTTTREFGVGQAFQSLVHISLLFLYHYLDKQSARR